MPGESVGVAIGITPVAALNSVKNMSYSPCRYEFSVIIARIFDTLVTQLRKQQKIE